MGFSIEEVEVEARGTSLTIEVSEDGGRSWFSSQEVEMGSAVEWVKVKVDVCAHVEKVRIAIADCAAGTHWEIRSLRFSYLLDQR